MNNYIKEIKALEETLLKQYCNTMITTSNQILRDEYLNMFDEIDDILLKLDKITIKEKKVINKNVENSLLEELQNTIEEKLYKIKC